jgi:glyoxylase-like metal-dependent hydrolase (beta-lactamase superfamily II)
VWTVPPLKTRSANCSGIGATIAHTRAASRDAPTARNEAAYDREMASVHVLHSGYIREGGARVGSSVTLIRDGDALIVADPGLVASRASILDPLGELEVPPEAVTHVFLSHHHPDHTVNVALFPNADVIDFWAIYRGDAWLDHGGDGWQMTEHSQLWITPGHSEQDATLMVDADDGVYALTHLWWRTDRTPELDPYCPDQSLLEFHRGRVLEAADVVIPGHGEPFRV